MGEEKINNQPVQKKRYALSLSTTIIALAIIIGFSGSSYYVGYKMGQKQGAELIFERLGDALNPLNALSNNGIVPNSVNGRFASADEQNITIKQANGEKTYQLSSNLRVTQAGEQIQLANIEPDQNITLFINKSDNDEKVNRIIARP